MATVGGSSRPRNNIRYSHLDLWTTTLLIVFFCVFCDIFCFLRGVLYQFLCAARGIHSGIIMMERAAQISAHFSHGGPFLTWHMGPTTPPWCFCAFLRSGLLTCSESLGVLIYYFETPYEFMWMLCKGNLTVCVGKCCETLVLHLYESLPLNDT